MLSEVSTLPADDRLRAVQEMVRDRQSSMGPGQRRMATVLLSQPENLALRSLDENSASAEVHKSSWVRFAKSLGFSGYPELARLCREHVAEQNDLVRRFDHNLAHAGEAEEWNGLLIEAVQADIANISLTLGRIPEDTWTTTIGLLAEAPRVNVVGLRKCLPVAQLLAYLLRMVRPRVRLLAPTTGELVDEVRELEGDEVLVAVSIRRYTAATVQMAEEAHRRGCPVIAITDDAASPLTSVATTTIYCEGDSPFVFRSVSALVSVSQVLASAVAARLGTRSREQLRVDQEMLTAFQVYGSEPTNDI